MTQLIQHISAVTFAVRDMLEAVAFYTQLGFELVYGGNESSFSSLQAGETFVNLTFSPDYEPQWSGRTIFRVADVDAMHRLVTARGLRAPEPRDASWGERFFHLTDPNGHELSFAELLPNHR